MDGMLQWLKRKHQAIEPRRRPPALQEQRPLREQNESHSARELRRLERGETDLRAQRGWGGAGAILDIIRAARRNGTSRRVRRSPRFPKAPRLRPRPGESSETASAGWSCPRTILAA
jgi:hypothetical protein